MLKLVRAVSSYDISLVGELFTQYADSLDFQLDFQNFSRELVELPGEYSPPTGILILALWGEKSAGCVAMRKAGPDLCEMKRLYVRPDFRGMGIGKGLARAVIEESNRAGYGRMVLDTISSMKEAIDLYLSLGFKTIPPYRYNPVPGAVFMELAL